MVWNAECQRKRFWLRCEWIEWIQSLPSEGFGPHTQVEWQDWFVLEDAARKDIKEEDRNRGASNLKQLQEGPPRMGNAKLRERP